MSRWERREEDLLAEIAREVPGFRVVEKDRSRFQRAIHWALVLVTLGGQRRYLDDYVTTIHRTIYVNRGWERRHASDRYVTLVHERVHLRQFARWGLVPMALLYLLVPVPFGLAWCRMRFEREAYEAGLRAACEVHGPGYLRRPEVRMHTLAQFTGPSYGWMWLPRRGLERWYDGLAASVAGGD